jgi:hypothetical protein
MGGDCKIDMTKKALGESEENLDTFWMVHLVLCLSFGNWQYL